MAHEGDRARCNGADSFGTRPARPERGKIATDPAALLQGDGTFLQCTKYSGNRIADDPHDEAIEQSHVACRPGTGQDAAAR